MQSAQRNDSDVVIHWPLSSVRQGAGGRRTGSDRGSVGVLRSYLHDLYRSDTTGAGR